jgi:hypothetical protein
MTVLVASVCIFFAAHYGPIDEELLALAFPPWREIIAPCSKRKKDSCRSAETLQYVEERHLNFPLGTLKMLETN